MEKEEEGQHSCSSLHIVDLNRKKEEEQEQEQEEEEENYSNYPRCHTVGLHHWQGQCCRNCLHYHTGLNHQREKG